MENQSKFDGNLRTLIRMKAKVIFITFITLDFGSAWAWCAYYRWEKHHTIIDSNRLRFDGQGFDFFKLRLKLFLLVVVTLGIYSMWARIKILNWVYSNVNFEAKQEKTVQ